MPYLFIFVAKFIASEYIEVILVILPEINFAVFLSVERLAAGAYRMYFYLGDDGGRRFAHFFL